MNDLLLELKNILIATPTIIFIPFASYGFVLYSGRALNILKTHISKNILALILIIGATILKDLALNNWVVTWEYGFNWFIQTGLSLAAYTLFIWRLFDRIDNWMDKKGLKDKGVRNAKVRK